jgi:chemotaxis signal transduction protein
MAQKTMSADSQLSTLLILRVAGQRLAVPAADIVEIVPALTLLPLADAPGAVEGLARIRGVAIAVIGVRQRLGLPQRPMASRDHLVICRLNERQVALHVDRVLGLHDCRVEPLDNVGVPIAASATGIATDSEGPFLVHDLHALFAIEAAGAVLISAAAS